MSQLINRFFMIALFACVFTFSSKAAPVHNPVPANILSLVSPQMLTPIDLQVTGVGQLTATWGSFNCPEPPPGGFKFNFIYLINAVTMLPVQGPFSTDLATIQFNGVLPGVYFVTVADCHSTRRSVNVVVP